MLHLTFSGNTLPSRACLSGSCLAAVKIREIIRNVKLAFGGCFGYTSGVEVSC